MCVCRYNFAQPIENALDLALFFYSKTNAGFCNEPKPEEARLTHQARTLFCMRQVTMGTSIREYNFVHSYNYLLFIL